MTIDPKQARPDVHQRFLEVCARERQRHAEHVAFIRQLALRPLPEEDDGIAKVQRRRDEAREP